MPRNPMYRNPMYRNQVQFPLSKEVKAFLADQALINPVTDAEDWGITSDLARRFRKHLKVLERQAASGDPWAQYHAGNIYLNGYIYSSKKLFFSNYDQDARRGSRWLEKAARQGFVVAVDNLVTAGSGPEAERLRYICEEVQSKYPQLLEYRMESPSSPTISPGFFEKVWEIAYGGSLSKSVH